MRAGIAAVMLPPGSGAQLSETSVSRGRSLTPPSRRVDEAIARIAHHAIETEAEAGRQLEAGRGNRTVRVANTPSTDGHRSSRPVR